MLTNGQQFNELEKYHSSCLIIKRKSNEAVVKQKPTVQSLIENIIYKPRSKIHYRKYYQPPFVFLS